MFIMGERGEILLRIPIAIVSGIVLDIWGVFVFIISAMNWIYTLFTGKRNKGLSDLSEIWSTQLYTYLRYLTLVSNERPFPFKDLRKSISKFKK